MTGNSDVWRSIACLFFGGGGCDPSPLCLQLTPTLKSLSSLLSPWGRLLQSTFSSQRRRVCSGLSSPSNSCLISGDNSKAVETTPFIRCACSGYRLARAGIVTLRRVVAKYGSNMGCGAGKQTATHMIECQSCLATKAGDLLCLRQGRFGESKAELLKKSARRLPASHVW